MHWRTPVYVPCARLYVWCSAHRHTHTWFNCIRRLCNTSTVWSEFNAIQRNIYSNICAFNVSTYTTYLSVVSPCILFRCNRSSTILAIQSVNDWTMNGITKKKVIEHSTIAIEIEMNGPLVAHLSNSNSFTSRQSRPSNFFGQNNQCIATCRIHQTRVFCFSFFFSPFFVTLTRACSKH